ncbi:MAG: DegT/DnrJ/EryC1/StrS family aminotransferase [Deltaproteobacteria bacterium]|nr:DegT/DnrJ/EryC1/StrS family aminotransferase [Deltaproteobacteria bacterium]
MRVSYLSLKEQFDDPVLLERISALFSDAAFVLGPKVADFERRFAALCRTAHAVGMNSGTDALFLALKALGVGHGDEVITVSNSFVATAGAIVAAGAKPVFVDVGPDYNMDPDAIEPAVTSRTKAVLPVHLTGAMADMARICEVAEAFSLSVVEDAAQAVGAAWNDQPAGSFGDVGCFSLHPLKNLNAAGDGGMAVTSRPELADRLEKLRNHGLADRDHIDFFGYNSRLDALQAVVAERRLEFLPEITRCRRKNAAAYDEQLAGLAPYVTRPVRQPESEPVYHTYVIRAKDRDGLAAYLAGAGVEAKIHYPVPIHLQKPAKDLGYRPGDLPETEAQAAEILSLPIHQHLSENEIAYVCDTIRAFYRSRGPRP